MILNRLCDRDDVCVDRSCNRDGPWRRVVAGRVHSAVHAVSARGSGSAERPLGPSEPRLFLQ